MLSEHIKSQIYKNFAFEPTLGQNEIICRLAEYISEPADESIFILNGYAGTGKTTLIASLVATLKELTIKSILLAPTGRAAKVMSRYCGQKAHTIHKRIYRQRSLASAESDFSLDQNREKDAVFIIDEVSMLSNYSSQSLFGSGNLLDDMVKYIRQGARCKLIMVGDSAQLPPIGSQESPALSASVMSGYGEVIYSTLDDVVRQSQQSGILFNATLVRCMLEADIVDIPMFDTSFEDVNRLEGGAILEAIEDAYAKYGKDDTLIITRSNKRANRFNEGVRRNVLYAEEEITSGDMLMVVKNNYHYTEREKDCGVDFIANGDTALLKRIHRYDDFYGFRFADATLRFADYDDMELRCKILIDTLASESPSLTQEQSRQLFYNVAEDYADVASKAQRYKAVRENPHFNAIQVKFAYAVTCHKAQGGQWRCVFIDKMLFGDEQMSQDLLRWLYTAITRASEKLYFVNFDESFFDTVG